MLNTTNPYRQIPDVFKCVFLSTIHLNSVSIKNFLDNIGLSLSLSSNIANRVSDVSIPYILHCDIQFSYVRSIGLNDATLAFRYNK